MSTRLLAALILSSPWVPGARAACGAELTNARFSMLLDDAETAYGRLDDAEFTSAMDSLYVEIPCLGEAPSRVLVARYDRVVGLSAFLQRDLERAAEAFAAARRIEPDGSLPTSLVPEHHPARDLYTSVPLATLTYVRARRPSDGSLSFDAEDTVERPASVPTMFQLRTSSGVVRQSAYLWPDDPLPSYPAAARSTTRARLFEVAAVTGGLALALSGGAGGASIAFHDPDTPRSALSGLRTTVNVLSGAAIGVGAFAGGAFVVALATPAHR